MFSTTGTGRRWLRRTTVAAVVAASVLAVAACSGSGSGAKGSTTLTIASTTAPISMDPTKAGNGIPLIWYMNLAYASLINRATDGTPEPGLATKWSYSADRMSFVLTLRSGVKFSDGTAMTANDVVAWLQHYKKSGQFAAWLQNVSTITATGPLEVTLKLSKLDPLLPYGLDQDGVAGDVVGPKGLANTGALGSTTVGAGPYMLDKAGTIANSQYTFVKNPYYYDKSVQHYNKIIVKVITDQNSILSALRSGQVQVAQGAATNAAAAKSAGLQVVSASSAMVGMYIADIDGKLAPALKDVRVRQALNYAIDRKAITNSVYGSFGTPTAQYVPKGIGGYVADLDNAYPYDPAKAKQLLAAAGYPHGFSFTLVEQPGIDSGDLLAQAMVANWKAVGVNVTLKSIPSFADYVTALVVKKAYPATTFNFNYSVQLVDTQQLVTNPAVYNYLGYTDAKANALAVDQRKYDPQSADGVKAAEAAETYMVQGAYAVPVSSVRSVVFGAKSVTGLAFNSYPWPNPLNWKPAS